VRQNAELLDFITPLRYQRQVRSGNQDQQFSFADEEPVGRNHGRDGLTGAGCHLENSAKIVPLEFVYGAALVSKITSCIVQMWRNSKAWPSVTRNFNRKWFL
jgi:hypothetical protein